MGKSPKLAVRGTMYSVYYASCKGGREPAKEYLEDIARNKPDHEARFLIILERFADGGQVRYSVDKLEGSSELIEFKIPSMMYRLLGYYLPGRRTVLLTGFDKKNTKMRKKGRVAIDTALEVKREFEEIHKDWCQKQTQRNKR